MYNIIIQYSNNISLLQNVTIIFKVYAG